MPGGTRRSRFTRTSDVAIESYIEGTGPAFVILPSYGRGGGEDFDDIAARISGAGWMVLRPQPRGVAGSRGPMTGVTLRNLADDIASTIRTLGNGPAVLLGHAFGHALSCMVATDHPDVVKAVVLAAGQASEVAEEVARTPFIAGDPGLPNAIRLKALGKGFFAPGHDAIAWLDGWHPETLAMQHAAAQAVPRGVYRACGDVPLLEVFGAHDPFKPRPYWDEMRERFGDRVVSVVIDDASHALFPEQPDRVAKAVMSWLTRIEPGPANRSLLDAPEE